MRRLTISANASRDAALILRDSRARFGPAARARYAQLLRAAYPDLQADPTRPGVRPAETADVHLYALRNSRAQSPAQERVVRPRHLIAFSFDAAEVRILRVLHERMDTESQLAKS